MKYVKKYLAILLAVIMTLGMATAVYAENSNSHTITINNSKSGHTYEAYQIFKGDISGEKLTNIKWGDTVKISDSDFTTDIKTVFPNLSDDFTAEDVANALKSEQDQSAKADELAKAVSKHLDSNNPSGTSSYSETDKNYTISVTGDGYYLIKDKDDSLSGAENDAYTKYLLKVVEDISISPKSDVPSLRKKIVDANNTESNVSNGAIGDKVNYKLSSSVPEMRDFSKYFFVIHDTLSKGLTYNEDTAVKIGSNTLTKDTDYTVTVTKKEDGTTELEIVLKDFIKYKTEGKGTPISITYSATINESASLGNTGNTNTAYLEYSNNPNITSTGTGDTPGEGDVTGKTPTSTVKTYVTGIQLTKVGENSDTKLTGAKFKIEGQAIKIVMVNSEIYKKSDSGAYYRLKDGTYTTTSPDESTKDQYESTETKYEKVSEVTKDTVTTDISTEGWVDKNGVLTFEGLGAGQYKITELVAPDGYNLLTSPIEIAILFTAGNDGTSGSWSASNSGTTLSLNSDGMFGLEVKNKSGATLPGTGGIGTTIFYVFGTIFVLGVCVEWIARRRTRKE